MIQYIIIGILFLAAIAWIIVHFSKVLSAKKACNKDCGCAEVKK